MNATNELAMVQNIVHYAEFVHVDKSGQLRELFRAILQVLECQEQRANDQDSRIEQLEEKVERLKNAFEEDRN